MDLSEQRAPVQEQLVASRRPERLALRVPRSRLDFTLFHSEHLAMLTRFVMRMGASPHEAAEAAHAAFVEAFPKWSQITTPRAWLRTVATRAYLRQTGLRDQLILQL
ncbi:sigma factor [Streptomyces viridochromogenes]